MTDLDHATLERLLPAAPGPADWDDVLSRSRAHERRRRTITLAVVVLAATVATASAFGLRALLSEDGFASLPPVGAAPSAPQPGVLVLRYGGPANRVYVYADGRVVWHRGSGPRSAHGVRTGYLEQRLTPAGLDLLLETTESTGLFDRGRALRSAHGLASVYDLKVGELAVRRGERLVRVRWCSPIPSHPSACPGRLTTPSIEQATALRRLIQLIRDVPAELPESAWRAREARAFIASRYAICFASWERVDALRANTPPIDPARAVASLPAPARAVLRGKRKTYPANTCSEVTTAEAHVVERALLEAGYERRVASAAGTPQLRHHGPDAPVPLVTFYPILPHGVWEVGGG